MGEQPVRHRRTAEEVEADLERWARVGEPSRPGVQTPAETLLREIADTLHSIDSGLADMNARLVRLEARMPSIPRLFPRR